MDAKARKVYGANEETWWLPYDRFEDANNLSKVTLVVTANESGSGLENLKLAENAEFTANTEIYINNTKLTKGVDYTLDVANRTIKLTDWYTPKLINANNGSQTIKIENVKLNNINVPAGAAQGQGNKIKLTVDDFVGKSKSENTITYDNTSITGTLVYGDSVAPTIATLTVEDSAKNTTTNPESKAYNKDNFTDSQTVILYLTLGDTEAGNKGSGVDKVILSDNAVFTGTTEIFVVIGSTETKLTPSTDYEIASDNKSVSFKKVFTETNKLKFTNVNIISATNGPQIIKADVQDFAGIRSVVSKPTENTSFVYDNVKPAVSLIKWVADDLTITAGSAKDKTISNQNLEVDFDEITAGVKVIKMDIVQEGISSTPYASPFGDTNFQLLDANGTPLAKDTDYTIDGQYIILTNPRLTGTLNFRGVTLNNATGDSLQGLYSINVALLDAAENRIDTDSYTNSQNHDPSIVIDNVAPVISKKLEIKNLHETTELTTGTSAWDGKWLDKSYIGGNGTGKAPDAIPVYITLKEKSSGVKVIKFAESAVLSADTTTLFTVDANGTPTAITPRDERYEVHPESKEIIIKSKTDAKNTFSKSDGSEFTILVDNVGFANADSATGASNNTISVTISDVAKNVSASETTVEGRILSDSIAPAAPQNLKLKDRRSSAATKTIGASEGYTNEDIVDMTFNLTDSEQFGSGYHKFVLNGATFIGGDSADKTTMTIKVGNTPISDAEFELSSDGKTLTLKKTGQASNVYAVIRQAVSVELKNVKLDNGTTDGSKPVTLTAYDMTGWSSAAASYTIILDTGIPSIVGNGPFVANHKVGTSPSYYYNPAINVYPHVSSDIETVYGTPVNSIPTFYTATSYSSSGVSQVNGQISLSSPAQYGVVLGFRVTDIYKVRGYNNNDNFMYYKADTNFSLTAEEILSGGTSLYYGSSNRIAPSANYTASQTNYALWFGFTPGNYSAVVLDSAGNVSNVFRFSVVQDTTKPAKSTTAGNANNLNERVLLQMPDNSAKAYTNSAVVVAEKTDFPTFNADYMGAYAIRTKKYIIKDTGANKKYKIQLNLGGTYTASTPIRKINNTDATETTRYKELDATATSSPIEMYAVSTYYGSWPTLALSSTDSGSSWKYAPVVPYGTTFPSGQTHDVHKYAEDSSNLAYVLGHNYFGYESGRPESNAWKIPNTNVTWHNYKYTGSWVTDSGNGIRSQIDSNNNLIIEIPNTQSTAPVSVFLRDGCGNMQYVVCGLYEESGKQIAVSFVIDKKLGYAETNEYGAVTQPIIMQNPYMTYKSSGPSVPWPSSTSEFGFYWNNNSGNGNQGGNTALGFMKDDVKKATYYNPSLDYSSTDNQYKLGLTLRFDSADYKRGSAEDILFDSSLGKVTDPDPDSNNSNGDYTCRALLYCTQNATVPTYDVIMNAAANTKNEDGGFRTEWVGVRTSNDASETEDSTEENRKYKITQTTILLDYPKPNYTTLGWTVNENNNEPKPYYMWYLFEDRVGNYEIAKVVNNSVTNKNVLNGSQTSTTVYDKWLYDNEGPKLLTRTTDVSANNVLSSQTSVNALVATNNGYVPYLSGNNVYVRVTDGADYRAGNLINSNAGWGTTHYVEGATNNRKYEPFMDLKVDEITGVRAFAWSNNSTPPTSRTSAVSDNNTHGDSGSWYAGYAVTNLECYIGASWTPSDDTNPYFDNKTSSSNYYHKYPGTKVNTAIPLSLLSDSTAKDLYLHVMDWTGNISTYHMGNSSMKFINDTTYPTRHYTETGTKDKIRSVDNEWLVRSNGSYIYIHIAGLGAGSSDPDTGKKTMQIRLPDEYFTDNGAGYKGLSLSSLDIGSVKRDTTGPYLEVDYDTYSKWKKIATDPTQLNAYYYDNVGNQDRWTLQCIYDTDAPAISSVTLMPGSGTTLVDTASAATGAFSTNKDYTHPTSSGPHSDVSSWASGELQEVYVKTTSASKVKFTITLAEDPGDFGEAKVNMWNGTSWETVSSTKDENSWIETSTTFEMPGYSLDCTADGTYYQIVVTDVSSNASYQYFKLIKDNEAPTFATTTPKPVVTLGRGSIGKIGSTYYYTADAEHPLKLNFAIADAGVGSNSTLKKFQYSLNGSTWLPSNAYIEDPSNIELSFTSGDIETIYFKDILGNVTVASASKPGFSYTYTDSASTSHTVSIPKLTYHSASCAAPVITTSVKQENQDTVQYNIVNEVETYGLGLDDSYKTHSRTRHWSHLYTEKFEDVDNTVRIKEKEKEIREKIRITFPAPGTTGDSDIIGYIKSDTALTFNVDDLIGDYSFAENFDYQFADNLPSNHTDDYAFTRYYYAVDIVGNVSPALTLTYSYNNPHIPKNVAIIDPNNSSTDKTNKNYINADIKAQMVTDGINFAKIIKKTAPEKEHADKNQVKYFSEGFMVVRCTLYQPQGASYSETPVKIELWDKWGEDPVTERALRAESGPVGDSSVFKVYGSNTDKDADGRYFCYIVFKPGKLTAAEDENGTDTFEPYVFDNNEDFNGSNLHGFIKGATCQSGFIPLDPDTVINANGSYENKVGWMLDKEGPQLTTDFDSVAGEGESTVHRVKGYQSSGTISLVEDHQLWKDGKTNQYPRDTYIYIINTGIKDLLDVTKYKTIVKNADSTDVDSGWLPVETENINVNNPNVFRYKIKLPNVENIHSEIHLKFLDEFENESVEYRIGKSNDPGSLWWIVNDLLTKDGATTTISAPQGGWTVDANNYTFDVTPPEGSIITNIIAKVNDQQVNITGLEFNDYTKKKDENTSPHPTIDNSTGNLGGYVNVDNNNNPTAVGFINVNGIKVTIGKITQDWTNKSVSIILNGTKTVTVDNFVTAKEFSDADITIGNATVENGNYVVNLTSDSGATLSNYITGVSAKIKGTTTTINTSLSTDKTKVTLTNVPGKLWASQTIELTVNASNNVTKSADVLTIGAIAEGDITVGTATWDGTNSRYEIPVTYSNGASPSAITSVTSTLGNVAFAKKSDGTTDDTAKILLTGIPKKLWASQDVGITISDGGTHTVQNAAVLNIQAYAATDFTVTGDATYSNGEYTITMADGSDLPSIEAGDFSAGEGVSVAWASPKVTLTVTQGWTAQTLTLKLKELELKTITVEAKTISAGEIGIALSDGNNAITAYPEGEGAQPPYYLAITITVPTGVTISKVTSGETQLTPTSGTTYGLNGSPIAKTVTISVETSNGNVSGIRLFPEVGSGESRFFGRLISGKGKQEVYTFGDSPKSAAALQSHVVELPKFIQKFWQNDETAADEVTSTVTKEAKKAEKKSSKKASKKAATQAAKSVQEIAQTAAVTELPVEALEEPKADDQLAMILPKTANTEEAEVIEPQASVSTGSVDVSVTEAEPAGHSNAALWIILVAFCAAIAGLVLCLKKKRA